MVAGNGPDVLLHCSMHTFLSFFWPGYKLIYLDMEHVTSLLTHSCIATTWACLCQVWRGREAQSRSRKGLFKNVERWASTLVRASIRKTLIRTIDPNWVALTRKETCGSICPVLTKALQVKPAFLQCCTALPSYRGSPWLISWYAQFSCIGMSKSDRQRRTSACFNI